MYCAPEQERALILLPLFREGPSPNSVSGITISDLPLSQFALHPILESQNFWPLFYTRPD